MYERLWDYWFFSNINANEVYYLNQGCEFESKIDKIEKRFGFESKFLTKFESKFLTKVELKFFKKSESKSLIQFESKLKKKINPKNSNGTKNIYMRNKWVWPNVKYCRKHLCIFEKAILILVNAKLIVHWQLQFIVLCKPRCYSL